MSIPTCVAFTLALASAASPGDGKSLAAVHDTDREAVEFNRDVRPILSQHCFQCHGPSASKGKLRLDDRSAFDKKRGIIVPGSLDESELFFRITAKDVDERMPPAELKKDLTADDIEILRRWIEEGAEVQDHWSFLPIAAGAESSTAQPTSWGHGAIDKFVFAELDAVGLAPSEPASRETILRRVTFDLTGLPPTPAELGAFQNDAEHGAFERVVDRLFASPAYGERMTLAWMDAARYGDTSVFHADGPRDMWPWRDWVINAYNKNLPFDQFTIQQLAGDLLENPTQGQLIASGFHRNNGTSDEGGAIDEELRVGYMVDRVKTTANVWLGLSVECAQCHDHKYDPISQQDYYRFYSFFNQSSEKGFQTRNGNERPIVKVASAMQKERELALAADLQNVVAKLAAIKIPDRELQVWIDDKVASLARIEQPLLSNWYSLPPFKAKSSGEAFGIEYGPELGVDIEIGFSDASGGELEWKEHAEWTDGKTHSLPIGGNSAYYLFRTLALKAPATRTVSLGSDDTIQLWLNGQQVLANNVGRGVKPDQERVELNLVAGNNEILLKICNGGGPAGFYFKLLGMALPDNIAKIIDAAAGEHSPEQRKLIEAHYISQVSTLGKELNAAKAKVAVDQAALQKSIKTSMVMGDLPNGRMTYVLERGQYDAPNKEKPVEPGVPSFILPMPKDAPANRLGLAKWLTDPAHPLTARVAVNRYWAMLFGTGLVDTVMDFGSQGSTPSHPELLDWLAGDFIASGWNVKHALKQIVMSATYRQSSVRRPELINADPVGRLLSRAPRYRLQGEFLRDQALAVSGLLGTLVGGPSVKPYQPEGLWNEVSLNKGLRFQQDHGYDLYRRSMYIYWKRSSPMPSMTIFDAPTRESCVVQRQRTNTPLQALVTLNDVQFVEAARHLAERMLKGGASFEERLDVGFTLCTSRPADELRRSVMRSIFDAQLAEYRADEAAALLLLATGESKRDESLDVAEHATWTVIASMLLNLDETLTRD